MNCRKLGFHFFYTAVILMLHMGTACAELYEVNPGDTLSAIGQKHWNIESSNEDELIQRFIQQVMERNPQYFPHKNPHRIDVGMKLDLPDRATTGSMAAEIEVLEGKVLVVHEDGEIEDAVIGFQLIEGDRILTEENAYVHMLFMDGSNLVLKQNSKALIKKFNWDESQSTGTSIIEFFKGAFRAISGSIARSEPENYQVITDVAALGVRGTVFGARSCGRNNCSLPNDSGERPFLAQGTYIGVLQGQIEADNEGQTTSVMAGEAIYQKDRASKPVAVNNIPGLIFSKEEFKQFYVVKKPVYYKAFWLDHNGKIMRDLRGECIPSMDYREDHGVTECE